MASKRSLNRSYPRHVVLARHLQQQLFQLIEAAQAVPRDGVSQARAQHHELVLPLAFGRAHGAPHGAVQAAQLALGAGIHVAHAADNARAPGCPGRGCRRSAFRARFRAALRAGRDRNRGGRRARHGLRRDAGGPPPVRGRPAATPAPRPGPPAFARRTAFLFSAPALVPCPKPRSPIWPIPGHQARGPQLHFRRLRPTISLIRCVRSF